MRLEWVAWGEHHLPAPETSEIRRATKRKFLHLIVVLYRRNATTKTTATLRKLVRDPRTGEVHQPSEVLEILRVNQNLGRTLLTIRWHDGGDCVVFPVDIEEEPCGSVHSEEMICNTSGEHRI